MRTLIRFLISGFLSLSVLAGGTAAYAAPDAQAIGSISGRIVSGHICFRSSMISPRCFDQGLIATVNVVSANPAHPYQGTFTSGSDGYFFKYLPTGDYWLLPRMPICRSTADWQCINALLHTPRPFLVHVHPHQYNILIRYDQH